MIINMKKQTLLILLFTILNLPAMAQVLKMNEPGCEVLKVTMNK